MPTTKEILSLLSDEHVWSVSRIYKELKGSKESLRSTLYFLKNSGHIRHVDWGEYKITDKGLEKCAGIETLSSIGK